MAFATLFTKILALFTLLGNTFVLSFFIAFVIARPLYRYVMNIMAEHVLWLGFLLSAGATIGSLVYSEVVGFPACILCWTQRIFMYPMMFLFGLALSRRDKNIVPYALFLSILGGSVALYQWVKDMLALYSNTIIPCPAVSSLPSCDKIYVSEYGYITIPMISLNAFILIALVLYASLSRSSINNDQTPT